MRKYNTHLILATILATFSISSFAQSNLNQPDVAGGQYFGDYYGNRVQLIPASQWMAQNQYGSTPEASQYNYQYGEFGGPTTGPGQTAPLPSWTPDPSPSDKIEVK